MWKYRDPHCRYCSEGVPRHLIHRHWCKERMESWSSLIRIPVLTKKQIISKEASSHVA